MSGGGTESEALFLQKCEAVQRYVVAHVCDSHEMVLFGIRIDLPFSLTAHQVMLIAAGLLLTLVCGIGYRHGALVPRGFSNLLELFVQFIRDEVAVRFLGEKDGRRLTPFFCSLFFFILALNLLSLLPGLPAATANLNVTGALAGITLGFILVGGLVKTGVTGFCKGFVPVGVPWPVLLMLMPIELFSTFIKVFTLMFRLFANLFAGHMVLLLIMGMAFILGLWTTPFVIVICVVIYAMELGIAFLQAFIFTLLSAVFIAERFQPSH